MSAADGLSFEWDQANSDPLPFVQVDRSAFEKASLLAPQIETSRNHALGGLVSFWQQCADRRRIEKVLLETKEGERPKLVMKEPELLATFNITVDPKREVTALKLEVIGLVERLDGDVFRIRGMSRAFEPIAKSAHYKALAVKAGKASAEARKAKNGTAQPVGGRGHKRPVGNPVENHTGAADDPKAPRSAPSSEATEPATEQQPNREPNGDRTESRADDGTQPNPEVSGQRSFEERINTTSQARRAESPEDKSSLGISPDDERRATSARYFVEWASQQHDELQKPGPQVFEWAVRFFDKYDPYDGTARLEEAFKSFLVWCSLDRKTPGWGLWLSENVWYPRWSEQVAKSARRSA